MRAVKGSLGHSSQQRYRGPEDPRSFAVRWMDFECHKEASWLQRTATGQTSCVPRMSLISGAVRPTMKYRERFKECLINPTVEQSFERDPISFFSFYLSGRVNVLCAFAKRL